MSDRMLTAAFFVARTGAGPTLEELAARAGVGEGRRGTGSELERAHLDGAWAGFSVRVGLTRLSRHDCLWIQVRQAAFWALRPQGLADDLPLASDPHLAFAERFGDACRALTAEVGVFVTHLGQSDPDRIEALYPHVLGLDAEALVRAFVGLLYLDERASEGFQPPPDRDRLAVGRGLALFAGTGQARWS